jgi:hypothetical protein
MTRNDDMTMMKIYDFGVVRAHRHTNDHFTTKRFQLVFENFILKI